VDSKRRDLNHPHIRIRRKVLSLVIQAEVCTKKFPSQSGNRLVEQEREKVEEPKKGPLQCWGCREAHILRYFPHRQHDNKRVYHVQEAYYGQ
jgi:hypothetical protein